MRCIRLNVALTTAAWSCLPLAAMAQTGIAGLDEPPEKTWLGGVTIHAFAEATFSHNYNRPDSGRNTLRVFDFEDRKVKLDAVELVLEHPAAEPLDIGFRVDAVGGKSVPKVSAASGLFRDEDTGIARDHDLQQVYGTWVAPIGDGLRIDVGKFVTPFGYEVIDGYDRYNDNLTRSLLFGFAIPFTHTGVRATYRFSEEVSGSLMAVQGWDNWSDNNDAKSIGGQLTLTPIPEWCVCLTAMGGPEQKDDSHDKRFLFGATSTLKLPDGLTFGGEALYGTEEGLLTGNDLASWSGFAGYARYDFSGSFALALRLEGFDDANGVRTGTSQTLNSLTLTPEFKIGKHCVLRGDVRRDWSNEDVFEKESTLVGNQTTASVGLIFLF